MLKYVEDGTFDSVQKQLPKYSPNANKTIVVKALSDAIAVKTLEANE
jgi:hypothetical protein